MKNAFGAALRLTGCPFHSGQLFFFTDANIFSKNVLVCLLGERADVV